MSGGFFDTGSLSNHNHSAVPGDGGILSNLAVTGTISCTGAFTPASIAASGAITSDSLTTVNGITSTNGPLTVAGLNVSALAESGFFS